MNLLCQLGRYSCNRKIHRNGTVILISMCGDTREVCLSKFIRPLLLTQNDVLISDSPTVTVIYSTSLVLR